MIVSPDDSSDFGRYSRLMKGDPPHLTLTIETKDPISIGDFVGQFTSLANQYEKFMREAHPDLPDAAEVFVAEVREGSIVAHLIGFALSSIPIVNSLGAVDIMEKLVAYEEFVTRYKDRVTPYFTPGGRDESASKADLKDFHNTVAAVANDTNGSARLEAAYFEDGKRQIRSAFSFATPEARIADDQIASHKKELEHKTTAEHEKVVMTFVRPDIRGAQTGKKSGEFVIIESVSPKPLGVVYVSDLAEQRIKHEIRDDVFRKAFVVDVNVEISRSKPIAYRIMNLRQVLEIPDDGELP